MRRLAVLLFLLSPFAFATQTQVVVTPHLRVLYDNPALADYAQRVATAGERALAALEPLFDQVPRPITITLNPRTDVYNAFAPPLPHPKVVLRPLFPTENTLGYRARDPLYLLILHELTHIVQMTYSERPVGSGEPPELGLVGEDLAAVPPSWFLEGIATYLESVYTTGGRLDDAQTRGLLQSIALAGEWPTLSEAGLITYDDWPGGMTRYLFGAGFIDYLARRHGFEAVLETLRAYNTGGLLGTFAAAWQRAVGTDLFAEWASWEAEVRAAAEARVAEPVSGEKLTDSGWYTGAPAMSPAGTRLAWVAWPPEIVVAELEPGGALRGQRTVLVHRAPEDLAWLDEDTLVYTRVVPRPGSAFSELFALELASGEERQLTSGARAHLPEVTPEGCILFVRDVVTEGSSLRRWCRGRVEAVWKAPEGTHIVGLAASEAGQIALSLWRRGFVDLALLEGGELRFLTQDAAQDLDPVWQGEDRLVFRSDRVPSQGQSTEGVFDLYALELGSEQLTRLSHTVGGAFGPETTWDAIIYAELGAEGFNLARLEDPQGEGVRRASFESLPPDPPAVSTFPVQSYNPWRSLAPYGWLPTGGRLSLRSFGFGLSAEVLGQDLSGRHSYALSLGYDSALRGLWGGAYANLRYDYQDVGVLGIVQTAEPLSFGLRLGLWPHRPHLGPVTETALGVSGSLALTLPLDRWIALLRLEAGVLRLESYAAAHRRAWQLGGRLDAALSNQRADLWGYRTRGLRLGVTGVWSATEHGPSLGLWSDASYVRPLQAVPGRLTFGVRAGYRQAPPVPVTLSRDWAVTARAGYRVTLPVGWRYGDGKFALERLSLIPQLHAWFDSSLGVGAELTLGFDTVLNYGAPVALTATFGYAEGFWTGFGVQLPL